MRRQWSTPTSTLIPLAISQTENLSQELGAISDAIEGYVAKPIFVLGRKVPLDQMWRDWATISTELGVVADSALTVLETTSVSVLRLIVIVVTTYYLLMDWQRLRAWAFGPLPAESRPPVGALSDPAPDSQESDNNAASP